MDEQLLATDGLGAVLPRSLGRRYASAVRADGMYVEDADGRRYLDGASGALVVNIGYGRANVAEAYARQATKLPFAHTSEFTNEPQQALAARLVARASGALRHVFFASGGSEAVETALKIARQYHVERGERGRAHLIALWPSYHGATLGALAASGHTARRKAFDPLMPQVFHIPAPYCYRHTHGEDSDSCGLEYANLLELEIRRLGPENVFAFIAEPVGGAASGALVPPRTYYPRIREICDRHGVLFIADEVMCGAGRTGLWSALDHWNVEPDLLVLGKGLASGYAPLAAVLVHDRIVDAILAGSRRVWHGFTYSGHPPSCAAALSVLDIVDEEDLVQRARLQGASLQSRLDQLRSTHASVGDVRGLGLLLGVEFVRDRRTREPFEPSQQFAASVAAHAFAGGLIVYPGSGGIDGERGDHILVGPPLIAANTDLDDLADLLSSAINAVEQQVS